MKNIYILCPAGYASGGPELLHQLCYKLNKLNYPAKMCYIIGDNKENLVHPNYIHYHTEYVTSVDDSEENILIIPEAYPVALVNVSKCKKVFWWLSVDNFLKSLNTIQDNNLFDAIVKELYLNKEIEHWVQSKYSEDYLTNFKIEKSRIHYLSDYLSKVFIENPYNRNQERLNQVLFNPKKGFNFTKKIIEKAPYLSWIQLANLSPDEMSQLMTTSKVYIDFGNHPGKDRIPREAVISGCCILTNLKGSAKYYEDVSITDEFKFEDTDDNIDDIVDRIKFLLTNYEKETKKFDSYRDLITNEETKFNNDLKAIIDTNIFE